MYNSTRMVLGFFLYGTAILGCRGVSAATPMITITPNTPTLYAYSPPNPITFQGTVVVDGSIIFSSLDIHSDQVPAPVHSDSGTVTLFGVPLDTVGDHSVYCTGSVYYFPVGAFSPIFVSLPAAQLDFQVVRVASINTEDLLTYSGGVTLVPAGDTVQFTAISTGRGFPDNSLIWNSTPGGMEAW